MRGADHAPDPAEQKFFASFFKKEALCFGLIEVLVWLT